MAGRYRAYTEYRDSGEEWLGDVPIHWDVIQIKHLSPVKRGASPRPIDDAKYFDDEGEYAWTRIADVTASDVYLTNAPQRLSDLGSSLSVKLDTGSLFLSIAGTVGKPCVTGIKACIHDGFVYFPELKIPSKFLFYVFAGEQAYKGLGKFGTQLNLNTDTVGGIKIGCTDNSELENIVNFLDHETAKIDTLIEKQQQLIKLLKEKRQAVISHAVTKGLNPNAPMRDSGVEWLGEVPEHWEVKPLKFLISDKKGAVKAGPFGSHLKNSDMEGNDVKVIAQKNVISRDFEIGESMISTEKYRELEGFKIERNDILVTTRGTIGRTAIYDRNDVAILHPCLIRIQIDIDQVYAELIALIVQESGYAMEQILVNSNATTIEVIYSENLINTVICLPRSLAEQKTILDYIGARKEYFDGLIGKANEAIELIKERRTALISAAVTGKIDVRGWRSNGAEH